MVSVVIVCPHCRQSLTETSVECPHCQLDLDKLAKMLGPVPVILGGVSDGSQIFTKGETKKLQRLIKKHERLFPQSRLHIASKRFDQQAELPDILFWIFNRAGLSEESSKRGQNRDIVLLIDSGRKQAAMMVGYGLEPILPQQALDRVLEQAQPFFTAENYIEGIEVAVKGLTELLKSVSTELSASVGLQESLATEVGINDY